MQTWVSLNSTRSGVRRLGPEDQETALVLNNLALLYANTGRHTEATSYFQRALVIWEKALGPDHPNVARALTNKR